MIRILAIVDVMMHVVLFALGIAVVVGIVFAFIVWYGVSESLDDVFDVFDDAMIE